MPISEKIKSLRIAKGLSANEVAERIGVSRATYYRIESKEVDKMPIDIIPDLAKALGTTIGYLLTDILEVEDSFSGKDRTSIPVYGSIPAGLPVEAIEDIQDYVDIAPKLGEDSYSYIALKVKGDSMQPKYLADDIVIVRLQPNCETGQDAVVYVNGEDATLKKVKKLDNGSIILQPINPAYDPMMFSANEVEELPVQILGIVIELRRNIQ